MRDYRLFYTLSFCLLTGCFFLVIAGKAQEVQWASKVINYSSQKEYETYSAREVLGEPNSMPSKGYSATAWEAATDDRREFLHVGFDKPMKIQQVIIAENYGPGAVVKVVLFDTQGLEHEVYKKGADTLNLLSRFFYVKFDQTTYEVSAVKISVDCRVAPGVNQIDAIGIADNHDEIKSEIKLASDLTYISEVERLGPNVNSKYQEVNPVISPDGNTLFINRKDFPPHDDDDEIWYAVLDEKGEWSPVKNMGSPLNTSNHNFVNSVTPDGNTMLLGNQYFKDPNAFGEGFSLTRKTATGWNFPENAKVKNFVNTDRYVNFFMSNDGKKIFMNVRREDTRGNSDLYISFLQDDGTWSEPRTLGTTINSTGSECCAFLASDNTTLYFSSDGYNGFGSNDIYMSRRLDDSWQKWSQPLNIGPPVNSTGWDAYYTIPAKGDYAYFVRDGDIYRVRTNPESKPQPVVMVYGTVFNQRTKEPVGDAKILYEYLGNGQEAGIAHSAPVTGTYKIILPSGFNYGFLASAPKFVSESDNLEVSDLKEYREIQRDLFLIPATVGEVIRLNNIFFDFAKSTLKQESFPELKRVIKLLTDNPTMVISLAGHTDNVGSDAANLQLSKDRAAAVLKYITDNGIVMDRLSSEGYGETIPVTTNYTEEGRALNRRVEFKIVKE